MVNTRKLLSISASALIAVACGLTQSLAQSGGGAGGGGSSGGSTGGSVGGGVGGGPAGSGVSATPSAPSLSPGTGSGLPGPNNPLGARSGANPSAAPSADLPSARTPSSPTEAGTAPRPGAAAVPRNRRGLLPGTSGSIADAPPQALSGGGSSGVVTGRRGFSTQQAYDLCINDWDASTHMTRAQWRRACRRTSGGLDPAGGIRR